MTLYAFVFVLLLCLKVAVRWEATEIHISLFCRKKKMLVGKVMERTVLCRLNCHACLVSVELAAERWGNSILSTNRLTESEKWNYRTSTSAYVYLLVSVSVLLKVVTMLVCVCVSPDFPFVCSFCVGETSFRTFFSRCIFSACSFCLLWCNYRNSFNACSIRINRLKELESRSLLCISHPSLSVYVCLSLEKNQFIKKPRRLYRNFLCNFISIYL